MLELDLEALIAAANGDAEFRLAARYWDVILEIGCGDEAHELTIAAGCIESVAMVSPRGHGPGRILVRASESDWAQLLSPCPPPGLVDVAHAERVDYHGDPVVRAAYHRAVRRLVELMREQLHGPSEVAMPSDVDRGHDAIIGRYVYLTVAGVQYRVYHEQAGAPDGIPLVMQHTAGSDARQWRHVLNDSDYAPDFRLIAYDLPFHGRSSPPAGTRWWEQEYMPTREWLLEFVAVFCAAIGVERPAFMGCSIGGLMAPVLAYEQPERYRAVIGVNAGAMGEMSIPPQSRDELPLGYLLDVYDHPHVAGDWKASGILGLMAPTSPVSSQREVGWIYGSGGPPVFRGDIASYSTQFRLTEEQARSIDTSAVAVHLLTGEYDPFAISGGAERLASWIDGCHHEVIAAAGHFAPSDNPARFKLALDPVLEAIRQASRDGPRRPDARGRR